MVHISQVGVCTIVVVLDTVAVVGKWVFEGDIIGITMQELCKTLTSPKCDA